MSRETDYVHALIIEIQSGVDSTNDLSTSYAKIALREVERLSLPGPLKDLLDQHRSIISDGRDASQQFIDGCDAWISLQGDAWAASVGRAVRDLGYSVVDDSALPDSLETLVGDICGPRDELSVECFRIGRSQGELRRDSPMGRHVKIQFGVPSSSRDLSELKFMLHRILSYSLSAKLLTFVLPASMCDFFACGMDDLAQRWFTYLSPTIRGWRFGDFYEDFDEIIYLEIIPIGNIVDISGVTRLCEYFNVAVSGVELVGLGMRLAAPDEEFFQRR